MWKPYESGSTVGAKGSESGVIVLDEEHSGGSRITFERDCRSAPFTITCGVYGLMVHTRFFGDEGQGREQYDQMKTDLAVFVEQLPDCSDGVPDEAIRALDAFVQKYP